MDDTVIKLVKVLLIVLVVLVAIVGGDRLLKLRRARPKGP